MNCNYCGAEIKRDVRKCPNCGALLSSEKPSEIKIENHSTFIIQSTFRPWLILWQRFFFFLIVPPIIGMFGIMLPIDAILVGGYHKGQDPPMAIMVIVMTVTLLAIPLAYFLTFRYFYGRARRTKCMVGNKSLEVTMPNGVFTTVDVRQIKHVEGFQSNVQKKHGAGTIIINVNVTGPGNRLVLQNIDDFSYSYQKLHALVEAVSQR